jgi:hypothetical protein
MPESMLKKFLHKTMKLVGAGLRPSSAERFISSLPLVFQKKNPKGLIPYTILFLPKMKILQQLFKSGI